MKMNTNQNKNILATDRSYRTNLFLDFVSRRKKANFKKHLGTCSQNRTGRFLHVFAFAILMISSKESRITNFGIIILYSLLTFMKIRLKKNIYIEYFNNEGSNALLLLFSLRSEIFKSASEVFAGYLFVSYFFRPKIFFKIQIQFLFDFIMCLAFIIIISRFYAYELRSELHENILYILAATPIKYCLSAIDEKYYREEWVLLDSMKTSLDILQKIFKKLPTNILTNYETDFDSIFGESEHGNCDNEGNAEWKNRCEKNLCFFSLVENIKPTIHSKIKSDELVEFVFDVNNGTDNTKRNENLFKTFVKEINIDKAKLLYFTFEPEFALNHDLFIMENLLAKLRAFAISHLEFIFNLNKLCECEKDWLKFKKLKCKLIYEIQLVKFSLFDEVQLDSFVKRSMDFKTRPVRLNRLAYNFFEIISAQCLNSTLSLKLDFDSRIGSYHFYTDPVLLTGVLNNLYLYINSQSNINEFKIYIRCFERDALHNSMPVKLELQFSMKEPSDNDMIHNLLGDNLVQPKFVEAEVEKNFLKNSDNITTSELSFLLAQIYLKKLNGEYDLQKDSNFIKVIVTFNLKYKKEEILNMEEVESSSEEEELDDEMDIDLDRQDSESSYSWPKKSLLNKKSLFQYKFNHKKKFSGFCFDPLVAASHSDSSEGESSKDEICLDSKRKSNQKLKGSVHFEIVDGALEESIMSPQKALSPLDSKKQPSIANIKTSKFSELRESATSILKKKNETPQSFPFKNRRDLENIAIFNGVINYQYPENSPNFKSKNKKKRSSLNLSNKSEKVSKLLKSALKGHLENNPSFTLDDFAINSELNWLDFFKLSKDGENETEEDAYEEECPDGNKLLSIEKMVKKCIEPMESSFLKLLYVFVKKVKTWKNNNGHGKMVFPSKEKIDYDLFHSIVGNMRDPFDKTLNKLLLQFQERPEMDTDFENLDTDTDTVIIQPIKY